MRLSLLAAFTVILANGALAGTPTLSGSEKTRCCISDKGPAPVPYTGKWLPGLYTRAECLAKKYGFWEGDVPNEAKKVCAIRERIPEDPVPPPPEERPHTKFYGEEKFTVVYNVTGSPESGAVTEHVSDWGNKRVEIKDLTFKYAGIVKTTKQRVIYDGAEVVTVDLTTGAVTKMNNPMYDKIVASMKDKQGVEYGKAWATAMGGAPTGKTLKYAGHDCAEWSMPGMGTSICVTPSGITLFNATKMGPIASTRKVAELKLGDGGPDGVYAYDATKVKVQPNLQDIMKKARGGQ
jgi:hypothetical protein